MIAAAINCDDKIDAMMPMPISILIVGNSGTQKNQSKLINAVMYER